MRTTLLLSATLMLATAGVAFAQPAPTDTAPMSEKPAVSNPNDTAKTPAAPVPGKNSFTAKQAKERLEKHGFSGIQGLAKDEASIWHATAIKDGRPAKVSVDYQGNITAQ